MIHLLYPSIMKLYRDLLICILHPTAMQDDIIEINFQDPENQKPLKEVFIGFGAMQLIAHNDIEGTSGVKKFRKEVQEFYICSLKYIKKKFPIQDKLIRSAVIVDPASRQTPAASLNSLLELVEVLPEQVVSTDSRNALCREFNSYQAASSSELPPMQYERIDAFWASMEELKDPATDQQLYPTLTRLAKHILLIPHSNAYCETLFSIVKKVVTDARSQLGKGKEGHTATSVYSETHGIRNTLCALLTAKVHFQERLELLYLETIL